MNQVGDVAVVVWPALSSDMYATKTRVGEANGTEEALLDTSSYLS